MLLAQDIYDTVLKAKCTVSCWSQQLIQRFNSGDEIQCDEQKFMLLIQWTLILQTYYFQNFDSTTNSNITPNYVCLIQPEIELLLAKTKTLMDC